MEAENITAAHFADNLQIGRPVISHILKGRNNPSLEVITKILSEMPYINAEWLLFGKGNMYREDYDKLAVSNSKLSEEELPKSINHEPDLFSQSFINTIDDTAKIKYDKEKELSSTINNADMAVKEVIKYIDKPEKKISKIIIYYSDNTYENFNPEK